MTMKYLNTILGAVVGLFTAQKLEASAWRVFGPFLRWAFEPFKGYAERMFVLSVTPMNRDAFGDLLDIRFQKIYQNTLRPLPDMIGEIYTMAGTNGRNNMMWSGVGALTDWEEFTGSIPYSAINQGYDVTMTPVEFAK